MPLITVETAVELAKRSVASRKQRVQRLKELEKEAAKLAAERAANPDFQGLRLIRVREQLNRIDSMLMEETEPQALKYLADSASRLQEQERQLANRPLPGSLRPSSKPAKNQAPSRAEPIELPPSDQGQV